MVEGLVEADAAASGKVCSNIEQLCLRVLVALYALAVAYLHHSTAAGGHAHFGR